MKFIQSIIVTIFTACALFLGLILLWSFLAEKTPIGMPFDLIATVKFLTSSPWNWRAGLVLLAIGLLLILLKMRELRREQCIAFDNPVGEVAISMDAVEDFIRRAGKEFPAVKSLMPRIQAGADGIAIAIRMDIRGGTNIPRLSEEMQNTIKNRVQDTLGINVSHVTVSVGKIVSSGEEEAETEEQQ